MQKMSNVLQLTRRAASSIRLGKYVSECLIWPSQSRLCHCKSTSTPQIRVLYDNKDVKGPFSVNIPGWSSTDCRHILAQDGWVFRPWRILPTLEWVRKLAKISGFLSQERLEKTNLTFFKCSDVERIVSLQRLDSLGYYPYSYPVTIRLELAILGTSSFQLEAEVLNADTQEKLFRSGLVAVCADKTSKKVTPLPDWWVSKYGPLFVQEVQKPLRVDLKEEKNKLPNEIILSTSRHEVLATDVNYYHHANNSVYQEYSADALLEAFIYDRLPGLKAVKQLEGGVKKIEVEWVRDSVRGDTLEGVITKDKTDPHKLVCRLYNRDALVYAQSWLFEEPDTQWLASESKGAATATFPFSATEALDTVRASVPGWEPEDVWVHMTGFENPGFLRIWRVIMTRQWLWVLSMQSGFGGLLQFEASCLTFVKCVVLERLASLETLNALDAGDRGPYPFGIDVKLQVSKVGQKSGAFQTTISAAKTAELLFRDTITFVSVDQDTHKPISLPEWWRRKYGPLVEESGGASYVVNIGGVKPDLGVLSQSHHNVRASHIDYYMHANNTTYQVIAAEALVGAYQDGLLPSYFTSIDVVEGAVRRLEAEFLGPCDLGDVLEAQIFMERDLDSMLYCNLRKDGHLLYAQRWIYDETFTRITNAPDK